MNPVFVTVLIFVGVAGVIGVSSWLHPISSPFSSQSSFRTYTFPRVSDAPVQWHRTLPSSSLSAPSLITPTPSFIRGVSSFSDVRATSSVVSSAPPISEDALTTYYTALMNVFRRHSFTNEEFIGMKKNDEGRFMFFEELAEAAVAGGDFAPFRGSFAAWEGLDRRVITDLRTLAVPASLTSFHASLVSWYMYHTDTARAFGDPSLVFEDGKTLLQVYATKAKTDAPKFSALEAKRSFSFIPRAQAQSLIVFGGKVLNLTEACVSGLSYLVGPPVGGALFVYTATLAINPYMYHLFTPGVWVIGRSLPTPGVCTNIGIDAHPSGIATVLFWGSSLTP